MSQNTVSAKKSYLKSGVSRFYNLLFLSGAIISVGIFSLQNVRGQESIQNSHIVPITEDAAQAAEKSRTYAVRNGETKEIPAGKSSCTASALMTTTGAARTNNGFTANTLPANDDGSTAAITLPFSLNYFGVTFTQTYVNNNGNITFTGPLSTYTPFGCDQHADYCAVFCRC